MNNELTPEQNAEARSLTLLVYILQALTFVNGITYLAAVIINHIKQDSVRNSIYASHFLWQMRTFWYSVLWLVLSLPLWALFVIPGYLAWCAICIWVVYRIIRGWLNFNDGRPMYAL